MALEPEWEAKFEPNSYGFRIGRSCHDAIGAITLVFVTNPSGSWTDISKCFDQIAHQPLLKKLNTSPSIARQIRAWLKAGMIDNFHYCEHHKAFHRVAVPPMANAALHGIEQHIARTCKGAKVILCRRSSGGSSQPQGNPAGATSSFLLQKMD